MTVSPAEVIPVGNTSTVVGSRVNAPTRTPDRVSSPRLVGEVAHAAGRATSPVAKGAGKVKDAASKIPGAEGILDFVTDPILRNILYQTLYAQGEPSQ